MHFDCSNIRQEGARAGSTMAANELCRSASLSCCTPESHTNCYRYLYLSSHKLCREIF